MRWAPPILALALVLGACAPDPSGPSGPIASEQFDAALAVDASAARQVALDFVNAYAASPTEGAAALASLVAGPELSSWVRWLSVQNHEFPGMIDASADVRDVQFLVAADTQQTRAVQVALSASVTFEYAPSNASAFQLARVLDGPVTLVRLDTGEYRVYDLVRDGVPMSDGIQIFQDEARTRRDVRVVLDSVFTFPPSWQFNVIVRNAGSDPLIVDPDLVGLYADGSNGTERSTGPVSPSLQVVPPGAEVAGLLTFDQQDSADGRVLTLGFQAGRRTLRFDFPLQGLVSAVPPPPPTGAAATGSSV